MERIKKIYLPVFEYTITIIVTDDIVKSREDRNEEIGGVSDLKNVCAMHSSHNEKPESWVFFSEGASVDTITHETFHATYALNHWINAEIEQEYFAFHMGYLSQEIFDFINIKNNKKNKQNEKSKSSRI